MGVILAPAFECENEKKRRGGEMDLRMRIHGQGAARGSAALNSHFDYYCSGSDVLCSVNCVGN